MTFRGKAAGQVVVFFESYRDIPEGTNPKYELALTNLEVRLMFGTEHIRSYGFAFEGKRVMIG